MREKIAILLGLVAGIALCAVIEIYTMEWATYRAMQRFVDDNKWLCEPYEENVSPANAIPIEEEDYTG